MIKDVFKEVKTIFADVKEYEKELNDEYEAARASGRYSRPYLKQLQNENLERLKQKKAGMSTRLARVKEDFNKEMDERFNFLEKRPSVALRDSLSSGINFSTDELLVMANKHKNNVADSRLLHDYALKHGYTLNNYVSREECEKRFNDFIRDVQNSLNDHMFPKFIDSEAVEMVGSSIMKGFDNPIMNCYPTPKTMEESIARDMQNEHLKEKDPQKELDFDRAFLMGFYGQNGKKEASNEEDDIQKQIAEMTEEEKADAHGISMMFGHKGEITQKEIDYIHSDRYREIRKMVDEELAGDQENGEGKVDEMKENMKGESQNDEYAENVD